MRILKIIGIGLVTIIALLLVVSFFLPSNVRVERTIVINAPAEVIYDQVNTLKKWEQWSPWDKMDPTMEKNYFGPESGTNAGYSWKGPKTGEGKMTVTDSKPNELIKTRLEFGGAGGAVSDYRFEPAEGGTKVTWTFESDKTNNPMFRYMNVMMNGMLVNQFDSGLVAIKRIAESMPPPVKKPDLKIEATTTSDMNYLAIRDTANMSDIGQKMGTDYGMIQEAIKKQGLQMSGYPFAIYYTDSPDNFIMDVAIGVDKTGKAAGNVKPGILKSGNAVVAHYFGNYDKMNEAYSSIKEWLSTNNKKVSGSSWEVYVWSPMTEKDTAKWQTDIYFPVE